MYPRIFVALVTTYCFAANAADVAEITAIAGMSEINEDELTEIVVSASRVANTWPAGTYAELATALRFDPQTDLQSRGLREGQSDITVRGGVFENTGFAVGPLAIIDPQTGHYAAELPLDPAFLSLPVILTGIDNAIAGFNSSIATVAYSLPALIQGGQVLVGFGSDNLRFQSLRAASVKTASSGASYAAGLSVAASKGDGSLPNGDHKFERYNLQFQRIDGAAKTALIVGYQDKFYGWPGAYTGFASLPETDHTKTTLIVADHRQDLNNGWWEVGAYYRRLIDDYDFNRATQESGAPGSFDHETKVYAVGFQGAVQGDTFDWYFGGQLTGDELVRSTDIVDAPFDRRTYGTLSIVPSMNFELSGENTITLRLGATLDASNRDSDVVSPLIGATLLSSSQSVDYAYSIEYASSSQVPGYTALGSPPTGLFGGNPALGREKAQQLAVSARAESAVWAGSATFFYRKDDALVDWTYLTGAPFARQANPVDLDVTGLELIASRYWGSLSLAFGYTFLHKDSDYGSALVDASFYALNYARHRATLALSYQIGNQWELRLDNEFRAQQDNPLRTTDNNAFLASIAIAWWPGYERGFGMALTADNVTDSDYQFFPGTPAVGRQVSLSASYDW